MSNISKTIAYFKRNGIVDTAYAVVERLGENRGVPYVYAPVSEDELNSETLETKDSTCKFSIVVPVYETNRVFLKEMIDSCLNQSYKNFELILADASKSDGPAEVIKTYNDKRIMYHRLKENRGISSNTNEAIMLSNGDYIVLCDHDDVLTPNALYEIYKAVITKETDCEGESGTETKPLLIYTDEDKYDSNTGNYFEPNIKPDFNLDMLLSNNYICHITTVEAGLMKQLLLRDEYNGAQDFDLVLRVVSYINSIGERAEDRIKHVPKVLYHWRCHELSTANNPGSKDYAYEAGLNAVKNYVSMAFSEAKECINVSHMKHRGFYRCDFGSKIFEIRKDLGAVGGYIYQNNKITGGAYDSEGNDVCLITNRHFSGPNHAGSITRNVDALDLRALTPRPELKITYAKLLAEYECEVKSALEGGRKLTFEDKEALLMKYNLRFAEIARKSGYRLLLDPQYTKDKYTYYLSDKQNESLKTLPVSIIIPNYNGLDYLKPCLESIGRLNSKPLEVIIVDNASKDGSIEWIRGNHPEYILIENSVNIGFTGAVNAGIRAASGKYIFLLNNDTTVESDCLDKLTEAMDSDEQIFSAGALMLGMDNPETVDNAGDSVNILGYPRSFANGKSKLDIYSDRIAPVFTSCAGAALYNAAILDKIGLFDDLHFAYFEDVDIGYRARILGFKNVNVRNALVYHKGSASTGSKHNSFKVYMAAKNSVLVFVKNMPLLQYICNFPFLLAGYMIKLVFFTLKGLGKDYIKGLLEGIRLSASREGRLRHVKFRFRHIWNYFCIQMWFFNVL